jgi:16S rRNA (guanine966-N2)-methyltransferase
MSLRLIGGKAKGLSLPTPPEKTRPTLVQLKRRLFDACQSWEEERVIDLCAGTGSLGLEAWSRGAREVILVECDRLLAEKLTELSLSASQKYTELGRIEVVRARAEKWLEAFQRSYGTEDVSMQQGTTIFFDPPYEDHELYRQILGQFAHTPWFKGLLIVESDDLKGMTQLALEELLGVSKHRFVQGTSHFTLFTFKA